MQCKGCGNATQRIEISQSRNSNSEIFAHYSAPEPDIPADVQDRWDYVQEILTNLNFCFVYICMENPFELQASVHRSILFVTYLWEFFTLIFSLLAFVDPNLFNTLNPKYVMRSPARSNRIFFQKVKKETPSHQKRNSPTLFGDLHPSIPPLCFGLSRIGVR